jgi:prepilin-type N-terminal cleavage/methylation domain-containing protein
LAEKMKADTYFAAKCSVLLQKLTAARKQGTAFGCSGLTLVELIVVVGILGALALLAIPSYDEYVMKAKNNACASELRVIDKAVTAYYIDRSVLPASLDDVGFGSQLDPWKRRYVYKDHSIVDDVPHKPPLQDIAGDVLNLDYDLYSMGVDGASASGFGDPANADDIVRANDGAYIGRRP